MGSNQKISGEAMRWLYDDDKSYQKAVRRMRLEEARELRQKKLAKQVRLERFDRLKTRLNSSKTIMARIYSSHRKAVVLGGMTLGLLSLLTFTQLFSKDASRVTNVQGAQDERPPEFSILKPNQRDEALGGVAYDEQYRVASFVDVIGSDKIIVSQQQLPERFKADPAGQLAAFATELNANEKLEVGEVTVYSGVSVKGPQTIVLIKNGLLVFMKSERKLQNKAWFDYISRLE